MPITSRLHWVVLRLHAGAVVDMVQHPVDGTLYYITYDYTGGALKQLSYTGNRTPIAVASADRYYGPTPLAVQFSSNGSYDPDGPADHLLVELWRRFAGEHAGQPRTHLHGPARRANGVCRDADGDRHRQFVGASDLNYVGKQHAPERDDYQPGGSRPIFAIQPNHDQPDCDSERRSSRATHNSLINGRCCCITMITTISFTRYEPFHHGRARSDRLRRDQHLLLSDSSDRDGPAGAGDDAGGAAVSRLWARHARPRFLTSPIKPFFKMVPPVRFRSRWATRKTAPANLQLSAASSNLVLVPNRNIVFGGYGANRTVTVTPAAGQTGSATITVTVNDGPNNTSTSFVVTVNAGSPTPTPTPRYTIECIL